MELESGVSASQKNPSQLSWVNLSKDLLLAYQSFGVVYGDLSTSPLYVYTSTLSGKLQSHLNEEVIFGIFSLIFWTLTLIPLLKYVVIILNADDNGEGGTFALYSLLCRHANISLLPNQQAADEEMSCYKNGLSPEAAESSSLKRFLENHRSLKTALLVVVLLGACMVIGDEPILWPVFVIATLAAIVGSQAVITATFSIIKQCHVLGCFPRVKIVHTSKHMFGQIYIPEINWILMILTLAVTIGFRDTTLIGNAYGLACMTVMFVTTFLMALVIMFVWQKNILIATIFLLFFWVIEGLYLSAALIKVFQGGWVPLVLSFIFMLVMHVWHYGTCTKYNYDLSNKVSLKWLLALGPSLGVARVPGIGLIYTELATGIPAIFSHFVTNLPAFHMVLVFVCVKTVPVPHVLTKERFLIGRVCPRPYRMYRCTVRYGYKDIRRDDRDFDNHIVRCIAEFIQIEAQELQLSISETSSFDGGTTIISVRSFESVSSWTVSENEDVGVDNNIASGRSFSRQPSISTYDKENPHSRRRHVSFLVPDDPALDHEVKQELLDLAQAMEAGVAYIMGHTHVKARKSSSLLKRLVINVGYAFLRTNCRGPATALNIPHISLIEVGMIYYV
ncbi:hypothetical protein JHK87_045309 [Glycine soja]|nr:hypothetical protein JHK87_045309 [Glycine soja]